MECCLPEVSKKILEENLQSIGVETYNNFQFIVEEDLLSALRPIQARKALAAWKLKCKWKVFRKILSGKSVKWVVENHYGVLY